MKKYLHIIIFFGLMTAQVVLAQDDQSSPNNKIAPTVTGYYQSINLDEDTPCTCDTKTQRTHDLAKGLRPYDVINYKLHAYKFTFGSSTVGVSKLFKAFENDKSVYKVSMKEWDSFMLLTDDTFNVTSFESAAKSVFATFEPIDVESFLQRKNTTSYNEYVKYKQESSKK
ncbi:MAG: hypothetical protein R2739_05375 [Chitinophagales bacterium]|nr:hypothetical protein [Bacteroidota bacterium]